MQDTTIIFSMHDSIRQHLSLPNTSCITICQHPPANMSCISIHLSLPCMIAQHARHHSSSACMIVSANTFPFPTHHASPFVSVYPLTRHASPVISVHPMCHGITIRQCLPDTSLVPPAQHIMHHHWLASPLGLHGRIAWFNTSSLGAPSGMDGNGTVDLLG